MEIDIETLPDLVSIPGPLYTSTMSGAPHVMPIQGDLKKKWTQLWRFIFENEYQAKI